MTYSTAFYASIAAGCRASAEAVVPTLVEAFSPSTVLDVGCGEGHWLAEFSRAGCEVHGIDGDYVDRARLAIDPSSFTAANLDQLPDPGRAYDLVLSLEVGEHLLHESHERYVGFLVGSAPVVVFSAAVPGQGGAGHIAEAWPSYWVDLFATYGYEPTGALRWRFWQDDRVENWYRQNLLVFAPPNYLPALPLAGQALWSSPLAPPWPVVHPVLWDARRPR